MAAGDGALSDPMGHSIDSDVFHLPGGGHFNVHEFTEPVFGFLAPLGLGGLTKFMTLEALAALVCVLVFVPFAWSFCRRGYARGVFSNVLESMLDFVRNEVAIPAIGAKDADRFVPFLWSMFFFIVVCNLLGMIPLLGSPTGALGSAMALAACTAVLVHFSGVRELGAVTYVKSLVPHVPAALYPLMVVVEAFGYVIKPLVLGFRLFVNMLAGHTVLYMILAFIAVAAGWVYYLVTPVSVVAVTLLSLLELLVAFLQAYVFVFLSAIFIGTALHPHH